MSVSATLSLSVLFMSFLKGIPLTESSPNQQNPEDERAIKSLLTNYMHKLETLDTTGINQLFYPGSLVVESEIRTGKAKPQNPQTFAAELCHIKTIHFSRYRVSMQLEVTTAFATEHYDYDYLLSNDLAHFKGHAVASTALRKENGQWKIASRHSSTIP